MSERRTTRSGYSYLVVSVDEIVEGLEGEEYFTWSCHRPWCGLLVQGGRAGLAAHIRTCHPEGMSGN
ncbi:hypothetical protein AB0J01_27835 [Streptomyces sp. NPDC050204]|uniref:hypothetical protein n=1 Tax=Streptomyces sp. NPDC050204 TaxID=3155514 RepID=UPI003428B62C